MHCSENVFLLITNFGFFFLIYIGVENLSAAGMIAGETSQAYDEVSQIIYRATPIRTN